jgi:hypothetical protein
MEGGILKIVWRKMSVNNRHHIYTEADIRRYLEGGMSRAEMHRLEVAALDDPFLHDAVDGYTAASETEDPVKIQEIVNELKKFKPDSGTRKYRNVIIPLWQKNIMQYAVAAMLVGIGGWYIFNIPEKVGVTTAKHEVPIHIDRDSLAATVQDAHPAQKAKQPATITPIKPEPELAKTKPQPVNENPLANEIPLAVPEKDVADSENPQPPPNPQTARAITTPVTEQSNLVATPSKNIRGKVTDNDDFPLDNITIQVKGSKAGTVTDELGRFNLKVADSSSTIIASAPGYKTKEITGVTPNEKLEMKLEKSSASLEEVVVSGYSNRSKESEPDIDTSEAIPSGGWKNFSRYLEGTKQLQKSRKGKKAEVVILSFEVDKNGRPVEFEILQSAGKMRDDEAIRLIEGGPSWINKTRNPFPVAKITVVF